VVDDVREVVSGWQEIAEVKGVEDVAHPLVMDLV
jgi:hypothetical protein